MDTVKVEYVGLKPSETDHTYGTGLTWIGLGSVHDVPAAAWANMAKHTDVWRLVEDQGPTDSSADEVHVTASDTAALTEADLSAMAAADIRALAASRGYKLHPRLLPENLSAAFLNAQSVAAAA